MLFLMTRLWKLMLYLLINLLPLIYLLVIALCMCIFNLIKGLNPFFIFLQPLRKVDPNTLFSIHFVKPYAYSYSYSYSMTSTRTLSDTEHCQLIFSLLIFTFFLLKLKYFSLFICLHIYPSTYYF